MSRVGISPWDCRVPWKVPRDLTWSPPLDMAWAGGGRMLILWPREPSLLIAPQDWGEPVTSQICAVLLVSAVQARAGVIGGWPMDHAVYCKRPLLVRLQPGHHVSVHTSESRSGELWVFPLRSRVGPPSPFINSSPTP